MVPQNIQTQTIYNIGLKWQKTPLKDLKFDQFCTQNAVGKGLDKTAALLEQVPGSCYPAVSTGAGHGPSPENWVQ